MKSCDNRPQNPKQPLAGEAWNRHPCALLGLSLGLCGILFISKASYPQQTSAKTAKVQDGTIIRVVLTEALSSAANHANDPVHAEVAEDVKVGDALVIAKGASAIGHVSEVEPKGKWGHSGKLSFSLDYAKAVDGSNIRLRASSTQGGQDSKAALMLGLSGAFKHGKDINVPKGTAMSAYADGDREVNLAAGP